MAGPDALWFKRAQRGLFAGKTRLTGHTVSPSKRHVKRVWLPNVQRKKLWSDILQRPIDINVTTHALRQIDRVGGVDNYLLHTPSVKLASETGDRLRKLLQDKAKFNAKKERLSKPATSTAQEGGAAQLS